ncbi:MAG: hypothetical protein ACKOS8_00420, partial [Gemmataceae bacterium]
MNASIGFLTQPCSRATGTTGRLSHAEYYRLMAFLDNAEEYEAPVPTAEQAKLARELEAQIAALEKG